MAGCLPPEKWEAYHAALKRGFSYAQAGRRAGISENTVRTFERERRMEANGRRSARTSSGWAWLDWRRATKNPDNTSGDYVVGVPEIAERLGKTAGEIHRLHATGDLPPPEWQVNGGPAWLWSEIEGWAQVAGRPIRVVPRRAKATA